MPNFTEDMNAFQAELSRFYAEAARERARRRIRYLEIAGACLLAGGCLLVAYAWGAWPW